MKVAPGVHRQGKILERFGVEIPDQTMCGRMRQSAELLEPLYGRFWLYLGDRNHPVMFDDAPTRERTGPEKFLKNFRGYPQADACVATTATSSIPNVAWWKSHVGLTLTQQTVRLVELLCDLTPQLAPLFFRLLAHTSTMPLGC